MEGLVFLMIWLVPVAFLLILGLAFTLGLARMTFLRQNARKETRDLGDDSSGRPIPRAGSSATLTRQKGWPQ